MNHEIITLGGAVVDTFVETGLPQKREEMCIPMGAKLLAKDISFSTGGGGINTSVAFSKLGFKTGFIGKLGKDSNSSLILEELKKNKVDFLGSLSNSEPTGFSIILDSNEHNRTILVYKGANNHLKLSELSLQKIQAPWFYFSSAIEETLKTQIKLSEILKKRGTKIAYNPSFYLTQNGSDKIKTLLKNIYALILNDDEARGLIPKGDLFKGLHSLGPEIICITLGKRGNKVSHRGKTFTSIPRKIKVKERTGAGDAFASGFVAGLIRTNDIKKAVQFGSANAESVIQKPGAKNGLLSWKEINKEYNKIKII